MKKVVIISEKKFDALIKKIKELEKLVNKVCQIDKQEDSYYPTICGEEIKINDWIFKNNTLHSIESAARILNIDYKNRIIKTYTRDILFNQCRVWGKWINSETFVFFKPIVWKKRESAAHSI